jgi:ribosomal protein S25
MENKKMTKKENFIELMNIVTNLDTAIDITENKKDNLLSFIEHEIELLEKKNAHKSTKPTKKQAENAELSEKIYNEMEESVYYQPKTLAETYNISTQKIVPIMTHLINEGLISKGKVKGKVVYFKGEEPKGE